MNQAETTPNNRHILDEIMTDFYFHQDPKLLKIEYSRFIDASKAKQAEIKKYIRLFSNLRYAWQKTLKYTNYFEYFYPQTGQIDKIEALNHHIHAYLEDMETFKNKIEVLFGEMKNDIKKVASNKKDIDEFFKAGIKKTREVFAQISTHRGEHRHRGMRFFDPDLLKAENAHRFLEIIASPQADAMLNQEYKPQLIEKFNKEREESFEIAKRRWIEMVKRNDEQTTGYLDTILKGTRSPLYQFLNIKPVQEIINSAENPIHRL